MEGKAGYPDLNQFQNDGTPQYPGTNPPPYNVPPQPQVPPHGMQPPGPVTMTTGVAVVPTVMVAPMVGPKPAHMTCRSCNAEIITRVEHNSSTKTHIIALLLCVFGCCLCSCIPYCVDSCRNADHYCPNCNAYIGKYSN